MLLIPGRIEIGDTGTQVGRYFVGSRLGHFDAVVDGVDFAHKLLVDLVINDFEELLVVGVVLLQNFAQYLLAKVNVDQAGARQLDRPWLSRVQRRERFGEGSLMVVETIPGRIVHGAHVHHYFALV